MVFPRTFGSDPKWRCHRSKLSTATRLESGLPSCAGTNTRPIAAFTPRMEKKFGDTDADPICSGIEPPERMDESLKMAAIWSNTVLSCCQLKNVAGEVTFWCSPSGM